LFKGPFPYLVIASGPCPAFYSSLRYHGPIPQDGKVRAPIGRLLRAKGAKVFASFFKKKCLFFLVLF
jgi:hypothetical protein